MSNEIIKRIACELCWWLLSSVVKLADYQCVNYKMSFKITFWMVFADDIQRLLNAFIDVNDLRRLGNKVTPLSDG